MSASPRTLIAIALCTTTAGTAAGCGNATDFTSAKMDTDVARTYANYLRRQQAAEGLAPPAAPAISARCGRGGRLSASTGAGKDWQCLITASLRGGPMSARYTVVARATACYTATNPDFGAQTIRAATGRRVDNPLYQFDGCLPG